VGARHRRRTHGGLAADTGYYGTGFWEQAVKVTGHKAASPPSTNRSDLDLSGGFNVQFHLTDGSFGRRESAAQTASRMVHAYLHGSPVCPIQTDRQTCTQTTEHQTCAACGAG